MCFAFLFLSPLLMCNYRYTAVHFVNSHFGQSKDAHVWLHITFHTIIGRPGDRESKKNYHKNPIFCQGSLFKHVNTCKIINELDIQQDRHNVENCTLYVKQLTALQKC